MLQPVKGTRDLIGKDAELYEYVLDLCRKIFRKYGFSPLYTPAFEYLSLLTKKSGEEIEKEIYSFKDKSGRSLGLRFDLTVPLARVVASHQLKKPYKRYAIGKVWRYDQPQSARWREFTQADIDIIGPESAAADLECIQAAVEILEKLNVDFKIKVNNRKLVEYVLRQLKIKKSKEVFRILDKQEKIGWSAVEKELSNIIKTSQVEKLISIIKKNKIDSFECAGKKELDSLINLAKELSIDNYLVTDMSLVRGLEYYTGNVFEIVAGLGVSIGGGGRYDNLTETIGGKKEPAVGISIGIERLMKVLEKKIPSRRKIYIAPLGQSAFVRCMKIAKKLRKKMPVEMGLMGRSLSKQLDYASKKNFDITIIIGERDLADKKATIRDMESGKEKRVLLKNLEHYF